MQSYKPNIFDANLYHHIIEPNFKGKNLCELCEKAILLKFVLSLDKSNTHQPNAFETFIRKFDLLSSSSYRNFLSISYKIVLNTIMITLSLQEFESSRVNSSSTSQKMRIWSHLLKKSLMENFIFLYSVHFYQLVISHI